ncbi:hypothetical protein Tco_1419165 [Tanacetum coccineum]
MSSITDSPDHSSQEDDENHQITFSESRHGFDVSLMIKQDLLNKISKQKLLLNKEQAFKIPRFLGISLVHKILETRPIPGKKPTLKVVMDKWVGSFPSPIYAKVSLSSFRDHVGRNGVGFYRCMKELCLPSHPLEKLVARKKPKSNARGDGGRWKEAKRSEAVFVALLSPVVRNTRLSATLIQKGERLSRALWSTPSLGVPIEWKWGGSKRSRAKRTCRSAMPLGSILTLNCHEAYANWVLKAGANAMKFLIASSHASDPAPSTIYLPHILRRAANDGPDREVSLTAYPSLKQQAGDVCRLSETMKNTLRRLPHPGGLVQNWIGTISRKCPPFCPIWVRLEMRLRALLNRGAKLTEVTQTTQYISPRTTQSVPGLNNKDFFNFDGSIDHSEIPYDDEGSNPSPSRYDTPSCHFGSTSNTHNKNEGGHSLGSDTAASENDRSVNPGDNDNNISEI